MSVHSIPFTNELLRSSSSFVYYLDLLYSDFTSFFSLSISFSILLNRGRKFGQPWNFYTILKNAKKNIFLLTVKPLDLNLYHPSAHRGKLFSRIVIWIYTRPYTFLFRSIHFLQIETNVRSVGSHEATSEPTSC